METQPTQNLLRQQIKIEPPTRDHTGRKALILEILGIVAAALVGYTYATYLRGGVSLIVVAGAVGLLSLTTIFGTLLDASFKRRIVVLAVQTIALIVFLLPAPPNLVIGSACFVMVWLTLEYVTTRREVSNMLSLRFTRLARGSTNKVVTAVTIMMILLYVPQLAAGRPLIGERTFDTFFESASSITARLYPDIPVDATVEVLAAALVNYELKDNPDFQSLSPAEQALTVRQGREQLLKNFEKTLELPIQPNEAVSRVAYRFVVQKLDTWKTAYGLGFFVIWALIIFFIVRSIGFLFALAVSFIALIVYELLIALGVIAVVDEIRTHQYITFI